MSVAQIQIKRAEIVRNRDLLNRVAKLHPNREIRNQARAESKILTASLGGIGPGNRRMRRAAERAERVGRWARKVKGV